MTFYILPAEGIWLNGTVRERQSLMVCLEKG